MTSIPEPASAEQTRLAALHALAVLDKPRRNDLDSLARIAAHICGVPMAAINLVDATRQWSAAAYGWEPGEYSRDDSMCEIAIRSRDVSLTANAGEDPRWRGNPFTDGTYANVRFYAAAPLILDAGEVVGTVCAFDENERQLDRHQVERLRDIADLAVVMLELRDRAERLGVAALRDTLTGLPNRALFAESLERALERAAPGDEPPAVLFLDLNGFKKINDTYGHASGDAVLRVVAERLLHTVRGADVVARLGGDEFVVLCNPEADEHTDLRTLSERIKRSVGGPIALDVDGESITTDVGVAIGAVVARAGETAEDLIIRADQAMYVDKRRRHSGNVHFLAG